MGWKTNKYLLKTGLNSLFKLGPKRTIELTKEYFSAKKRKTNFPLESAYLDYFFETDHENVRAKGKQLMRETSLIFDFSQIESSYPFTFEHDNRIIRYAFLKAKNKSKGLVVLFHGHNAFLHAGPMEKWNDFDVLAPWDNFGWNRQGSWFWGEQGENFVEKIIWQLIQNTIEKEQHTRWFCFGGSMGGFASLYYGINYKSNGMYVMCPQVDLKQKIIDYGIDNKTNPYTYLMKDNLDSVPNVLTMAEGSDDLPPLYLNQHQYDSVNPFDKHGSKIVTLYNQKRGWLGLRVQPAIGHMADGTQQEAELFFNLIISKNPPNKVEFNF